MREQKKSPKIDDEIRDYIEYLEEDCLNQRGFVFTFCKELMIDMLEKRRNVLSGLVDVDGIIERLMKKSRKSCKKT